METLNEIFSDRIDYLHALRHAEPLPKNISISNIKSKKCASKLKSISAYILLAIGISGLLYLVVMANKPQQEKD